jgi:hypothetical protein
MMTMTTTQHLGHVAGRARRIAPSSWRAAAAFGGRGTTGVDMGVVSVNLCTTGKRPARHLGSRST